MGQCSSTVRQWTRQPPPGSRGSEAQNDSTNTPAATTNLDTPSLRRRRSTDGMVHQIKRQRPHGETDTDREISPETLNEDFHSRPLEDPVPQRSSAALTAPSAQATAPDTPTPTASNTTVSTSAPSSMPAATSATRSAPFTSEAPGAGPSPSAAPQTRDLSDTAQEIDSVSSVSISENSGRSSPSELLRRLQTFRRIRDSLASPFTRRPSGSSSVSGSRSHTPLALERSEDPEEIRSLEGASSQHGEARAEPVREHAPIGTTAEDQAPAHIQTPDAPSSPRSEGSRDDSEFFDASAYISPPEYDRDRLQERPSIRPRNYPPPLPRTRPPPPPLPLMPPPWAHRSRRDDENEQVTILSRVLLAAATLTATHLVGEHISRGELYGGSNETNRMRQGVQSDTNAPREDARSSNAAERPQTEQAAGAAQHLEESTSPLESHQGSRQDALQDTPDAQRPNGHGGDNEQSNGQQNGQQNSRPMLSFPDFLEQLRTGRHTPELSRVMFDSNQVSNFFRFFRFPEDHEGRIPILLMGIRSAENTRRSDDDTGARNESGARRGSGGLGHPFTLDEEQSTGFEDQPRRSSQGQDRDDWNAWNVLDPQLYSDPFGIRRTDSEDNESEEEIEEYAAHVHGHNDDAHNVNHDVHGPDANHSPSADLRIDAHNDVSSSDDNEQIFFEDNDDLIPESNPGDLFMGSMLEGLVSGPFSRTGREDRDFNRDLNREPLGHDERRNEDFGDDGDDIFNMNARPFSARPRPARPAAAEPRNEAGPTPRTEQTASHQSWVIYVIGGAYPPSHPIFFAPSLLSDNPTYEDMLIFEQLLGPVKPAVATKNDVAAAGGEFTVTADSPLLAERCPICLMDYVEDDTCRELSCKHSFHQECVDSWLTRSHNSCPMCRNEGVPATNRPQASQTAGSAAGAR